MLGLGEALFRKDESEKVISITEQAFANPEIHLFGIKRCYGL